MAEVDQLSNQETRVPTRSLPEGALFVAANGTIYQVVLAGSAGFRKAKRWGGSDREAVALVSNSPLAYHYPVVEYGTPLTRITRANLVTTDGETSHFLFPGEELARAAAHLDEALAWQSGLMARKEGQRWFLTDGLRQFRVYHYEKSDGGQPFSPTDIKGQVLPYTQGPSYWSHLSGAPDAEEPIQEIEMVTAPEPVAPPPPTPPQTSPTPTTPVQTSQTNVQKGKKMILSVDIGYGYTKGVGPGDLRFSFPSVIGNAEEIAFTSELIASQAGPLVSYGGRRFFYGEQALLQSRLRTAIFDRSRVRDETYRLLFASALAELARFYPEGIDLNVVTGLPVGFFGDRSDVVISLEGEYRLQLDKLATFNVEQVFVVPQPFGSLFRELLNEDGAISNVDVEKGRVAVIDVGTYTTDFIVADELRYIQRLSSSISVGWSEALNNIQRDLSDRYRLDLSLHDVDKAVRSGGARVKGQPINLQPMIAPAVRELEATVVAKARDLWGEGEAMDALLVAGGAAQYLSGALETIYPHARLVSGAFWANAEGFYRFGQRPAIFGED